MEAARGKQDKAELPDFDSFWDFDRPGATERRFRDLLPAALDSRDISYFTQLLTQIARAEGLQRKFEDAHKTLDRVELSLAKPDADDKTRVRYMLERGRVFNSTGNRDVARPLFQDAFELAVKIKDDSDAVDAARMIAMVEPPEKGLQWNLKALDIAENSKDEKARKWKGGLYNNLGWTYFDNQMFEEALMMFEKVLELRQQEGDQVKVLVARWGVAKVLRMMGHTEEA
ncbi:MAG TPA: tetratricopeptide repeat protein, partial [Candidatus Bathyarchaeia archaeon]|nr:tetratricopeptide repeat protein [Candidatus Bathyarchaeia archaeon]